MLSQNCAFIHQTSIEELLGLKFDIIVSRAFAPLDKLFGYVSGFLKEGGFALFLKGKNLSQEIEAAKEKFNFSYELFSSLTSDEGNIIKAFNILKRE
jgi:16S rRNA (guanine527-N7)-methyltransferase